MTPRSPDTGARAAGQLALLALVDLLAMSLWFSASAVVPELREAWGLDDSGAAWLTTSVQLGFATGAVLSALLTLSDVWDPRRLIAGSALLGAAATAAIAVFADGLALTVFLRFVTGVALAGVYPPGMKMVAGWFRAGRGMAIGVLIGALAVGSAMPHLLRPLGGIGAWRPVLLLASGFAIVAALLAAAGLRAGPHQAPAAPFDPRAVRRMFADRATMLANGGYFGHMWELFAMWTWIPAFLAASFAADPNARTTPSLASYLAFGTIAAGGLGAAAAGVLADRVGRTAVTSWSMVVSGACCLVIGPLFGGPIWPIAAVCLVWGFAIVADSAQFSACVSELAEPEYVGTALTLQTAIGFLLTIATIRLIPVWESWFGWEWAFAPLAIGPALGTWSMLALRRRPEAARIAGGRR
ncbi:MFS transporter [Candidatus Palauibacter soopunensis]|uniref:MFS transporter n=1 Tax=Candidatus Palauibacter soopunensis TaxID=3056739 RepID=UPI0023A699FC|nr:MFS transporter [Candidatus Palauibacter soopunensis]MDE2878496.1 MFS transporter [Candidatus Palauibacter soopunensis]